MSRLLPVIFWACAIAVCGCSTVRVSQDYRPGTVFSDLKTYVWVPQKDDKKGAGRMDDPLIDERIRKAVERNLSSKGFRKGEDVPDFLIDFQYTVRQVVESENVGGEVGFGSWGWRSGVFGGIGVGTGTHIYTGQRGVLYIDVIDPKNGDTLWRGKGTHQVEEHWEPETKTEKIDELVEKTLAQFPPASKG